MKSINWTTAVTLATTITGIFIIGAPAIIRAAHDVNVMSDLNNLATIQEYALATDGEYSEDLTALTSGAYEYKVSPTEGVSYSVAVDTSADEYVIVAISASGTYLYKASNHAGVITGSNDFDASIVGTLVESDHLIQAAPVFANFDSTSQVIAASE